MVNLTDEEFESAIQDAIDSIPEGFLDELENVAFIVADEPDEELLEDMDLDAACGKDVGGVVMTVDEDGRENHALMSDEGDILGLYDGVSLYDRGDSYGAFGDYPDTITIFKGPHERLSDDREVVLEEIRRTVIHEVGHYFGMDEGQLDDMGYGDADL